MAGNGKYSEDFTREMVRRREATEGDPLRRREAVNLGSMLRFFLNDAGLMPGWNSNRVYMAWDRISGAAGYTLGKSFIGGVLYCSLSSSVVRSQLYFQRDVLLNELNRALKADAMFFGLPSDGSAPVKSLVLK